MVKKPPVRGMVRHPLPDFDQVFVIGQPPIFD